eukprot:scaffold80947_cov29-Tisochrysis_lutea.AAC.1
MALITPVSACVPGDGEDHYGDWRVLWMSPITPGPPPPPPAPELALELELLGTAQSSQVIASQFIVQVQCDGISFLKRAHPPLRASTFHVEVLNGKSSSAAT